MAKQAMRSIEEKVEDWAKRQFGKGKYVFMKMEEIFIHE